VAKYNEDYFSKLPLLNLTKFLISLIFLSSLNCVICLGVSDNCIFSNMILNRMKFDLPQHENLFCYYQV